MEPLLLTPVGKDYLWGGNRLFSEYNKKIPMTPLAETWECSVHPDGPSVVRGGPFGGKTLRDVLAAHPEYLGSRVGEELPILVKFIDAEKDLSVQVHPDDEYARIHEGQNGKTEMWYVLEAKPGAKLVYGFAHDVTAEQLREGIREGSLSKHLQYVSVRPHDVYLVKAGTVHAIGEGLLIAEIQENSNVTYRVYDYDRVGKDGKKRPLHFEKALEVMDCRAGKEVRQNPMLTRYFPGCSRELLCRCPYFEVERIQMTKGFSFSVNGESFQVLLCIEGSGGLETDGNMRPLRFKKGDCIYLPAGLGRSHILGEAMLLKIRC